ncbi:zinc-binding dehydrogenase [Candidatus Sumerlaeota bacterium]|nr:zinc-binding dehydrogenase [Candidatus Sumerlaeota bacterium]
MPTAAVMPAPRAPLELREFPEPELTDGAALLETMFSEVCGTDVHLWHGRLSGVPYPIIPGHVSVGRITRMCGEIVDVEGEAFREGDIVAFMDVHGSCGHCYYCTVAKATTRCPERRVYGITFSADEGLLGGWATHIWLKPGTRLLRLPEGLDPAVYIGGGCGLNTAFHAVERADIAMGDTVAVQGAGPVGLSCVAFARLRGAGSVICLGAPAERLAIADEMGADATIDISKRDESARRREILGLTHGRGADVVIEATGHPGAVAEAMRFARDQGRVVVCGQYTDAGSIEINPHLDINRKHLDLRGCWGSDFSHFHRSILMLGRHHRDFAWHRLAERQYPLSQAQRALEDVEALRVPKAVICPPRG